MACRIRFGKAGDGNEQRFSTPNQRFQCAISRSNPKGARNRENEHCRHAFIQELFSGRAGIAFALFGNTINVGFLLSGLSTGLWANVFGYWSLFLLCGTLWGFGAITLIFGRHPLEPPA